MAQRPVLRFICLVLLLALTASGALAWRWFDREILAELPDDLSSLRTFRPPTACEVLAADGSHLDRFAAERRIWVDIDRLPDHVWRAFVAAEDRRFLEHRGVDPRGIARAFLHNLRSTGGRQGGSTITQQVVKNLLVGSERTYRRKLREAVLALRLEQTLSKREILQIYLNIVPLGSGNYGVEAASLDYFGRPASRIDRGEAALIAGLVPSPSRFSPRRNPASAKVRRDLVLRRLAADGHLDEAALAAELSRPLERPPARSREPGKPGAAFVTRVRRQLRDVLGARRLERQGLKVFTSMDPAAQAEAEAAVREAVAAVEQRQGRRVILGRIDPGPTDVQPFDAALLSTDGSAMEGPPGVGDCLQARVPEDAATDSLIAGGVTFRLDPEEQTVLVHRGDGKPPAAFDAIARPRDIVAVCLVADDVVVLDPQPHAEGAAVVVENATGRIKALVGGFADVLEGFVRATQSRRQAGSAFKPFVYAAALAHGRRQTDVVMDGPVALRAGGGRMWRPQNYDGEHVGRISLRRALAKSINTVAVRLFVEVGQERVRRVAGDAGISSPLGRDPTLALGSAEVSPLELAMAYSTFARAGLAMEPSFIDRVERLDGVVLARSGQSVSRDGVLGALPGGPGKQALQPAVAYELYDMLREVVASGTARRALLPGRDRAGKTGTTNEYVDAWFAGMTPTHTVVVWIGTDGTQSLGQDETGGRAALPAWQRIMATLESDADAALPVPDEAILIRTPAGGWVGAPRGVGALTDAKPSRHEPLPDWR